VKFREHVIADLLFLGKSYPWIHKYLDAPVKILGAGHRSVSHSEVVLEVLKFFDVLWGKDAIRVALFHILIDNRIYDRDFIESIVREYKLTKDYRLEKREGRGKRERRREKKVKRA